MTTNLNVKGLATALRQNYFATHFTLGLFYAFAFMMIVFIIIAPFFENSSELVLIAIGVAIYLVPLYFMARIRNAAYPIPVRIGAALIAIVTIFAIFFALALAGAFIGYDSAQFPYEDTRAFVALVVWPITTYYLFRIILASFSTFFRSYGALARIYRQQPKSVPRLFNLLPPSAAYSAQWKKVAGYSLSFIAAALMGFAIFGLFFQFFSMTQHVLPMENGEFPTNRFTDAERAAISTLSKEELDLMSISQGFAFYFILPLFALITAPLRFLASQLTKVTAEEILQKDDRAPLVYLRAFNDDKLKMKGRWLSFSKFLTQTYRIKKIDQLLAEYFSHIGPVIAVQDQRGSKISALGPALEKLGNDDWQANVHQRLQDAKLVVLQMNITEGLTWEFEQ